MSSDTFKASTQYNDLLGSAAADRADQDDAGSWLESQGLIKAGEFLVGVETYVSSALAAEGQEIVLSTSFILVQAANFDDAAADMRNAETIPARKVSHDFSPTEFFSLFKRFNVTLSSAGELEGRQYSFD
jgi:hypothetical protein